MRLMLLPLAVALATCAPIGAQEPPPVSVRSPSDLRAAEAGTVTLRLPCTEAGEADEHLAEAGYVLVAAGVAHHVVVRLYLGGRDLSAGASADALQAVADRLAKADAFALVGFDGQGRACLLANGEGWTRLRSASFGGQAGLPAQASADAFRATTNRLPKPEVSP